MSNNATLAFVEPTPEQKTKMKYFRDKMGEVLLELQEMTPNRGISMAMTKLEEASMWLNKGITNNC